MAVDTTFASGSNYQAQGGILWFIGGTLEFGASSVLNGDITVGEDTSGYDLTIYGDTTGKYFRWDSASDQFYLKGGMKHHHHLTTEDYAVQLRTEHNAATGQFFGMDMEVHQAVSRTAGLIVGLHMTARNVSTATLSSTAQMYAGYFLLDNDGTFNSSGIIAAALVGKVDAGGTFTEVSHLTSLWLDSNQEGTVTGEHELLYMTNNGASVMDRAIYVYGGDKITNLFELNTVSTMAAAKVSADVTFSHYRKVNVTIDGVQGWLVVGFDS